MPEINQDRCRQSQQISCLTFAPSSLPRVKVIGPSAVALIQHLKCKARSGVQRV